jgi:ACS family hexuronate transporter-like MFS transporter
MSGAEQERVTVDAAALEGHAPQIRRWLVVALLFFAATFNYFDRQMIAVLKPLLAGELGWSEAGYANIVTAFQAAYAVSYLLLGHFVDRFGAKAGFAVAFAIWSIAQIAHGFARSIVEFMAARVLLGAGEGGAYPAGLTAIESWFPRSERAFATGIFNAGVNIGAIVTPLIVPAIVLAFGWRLAFMMTGAASFVWLAIWLIAYRSPRAEESFSERSSTAPAPAWHEVIGKKETWAYAIAKFLIDPIWWMYLFWLPDFFARRYGLDLKSFGPPLVAVYVLSDIGNLVGGWFSSHLIKRGARVNIARKITMLICALLVTPISVALYADNLWVAVGIVGLAAAAHQAFSVNLFTFPSDVFPGRTTASVIGFGGMLGAIGGMLIAQFAGWVLGTLGTYTPLFALAASVYLIALFVVHLLSPRLDPVKFVPRSV